MSQIRSIRRIPPPRPKVIRATILALVLCLGGGARAAEPAERIGMLREAKQHVREGKLQRAKAIYELILVRDPRDDEARAGLARVLAWSDRRPEAERLFREILRRHPDDLDVCSGLIDVLLWQRKWKEAQRALDEGQQHHPGSAELLEREARLSFWTGNRAKARALADLAASRGPSSSALEELRSNLFRGEVRLVGRHELLGKGLPDLPSADATLMLRDNRSTFRLRTWQGLLLSTDRQGARDYNATYTLGASRRVDDQTTLGADLSIGLPARAVPQLVVGTGIERPLGTGLTGRAMYAFRLYRGPRQVHTLHPAVALAISGNVSVEARYWFTYFRFPSALSTTPKAQGQVAHAYGLGVVYRPAWHAQVGGDYAHGTQFEIVGDDFRVIGLGSDSASLWAERQFNHRWGLRPRYGIERRSTETGFVVWVHTGEMGVFRRW